MIVSCPSCETRYLVDPAALGEGGRTVRCARCGHTWHQDPPEDMPKRVDPIPVSEEPPPIPPGSNLPALVARRRRANRIGWVVLAACVAAIVVGVVVARNEIVGAWPPMAKLYETVGLPVETHQDVALAFENVALDRVSEGGVSILVVRGAIKNTSAEMQRVGPIRVGLMDSNKLEIHHWTFAPDTDELAGGASAAFETRLPSPPDDATGLSVRFADDGHS